MMMTARDRLLLLKIQSFGMLSTSQVNEIFFPEVARTTVLRRLRILEERNLLKRLLGLESQEVLWILTEKGAGHIGTLTPKRNWSKNLLDHDHRLVKLRLLMECIGVARSWKPEHEIRSIIFRQTGHRRMSEKLVPDGLMGVEVKGKMESVAVELELTIKSSARYDETFRKYSGKESISAIWFITETDGASNHIYRRWKKAKGLYRVPELHLTLLDEVMTDPLKARLMGESCNRIGELWTPRLTAHSPAQGVSNSTKESSNEKRGLTLENQEILKMNSA